MNEYFVTLGYCFHFMSSANSGLDDGQVLKSVFLRT